MSKNANWANVIGDSGKKLVNGPWVNLPLLWNTPKLTHQCAFIIRTFYQTSPCNMANGVWWVFPYSSLWTIHINLIFLLDSSFNFSQSSFFPVVGRSQCYVLLVSCLPHLSQLGPSKETDVLVGPGPALCHTGSWYHGEDGVKTLSSEASEQAHTTSKTIQCVVRSQNGWSGGHFQKSFSTWYKCMRVWEYCTFI